MTKDHFNPTVIVLSRSIGHAASKEELYIISQQIEQAGDDFKFLHIPNKDEDLADLRRQLQDRLEELQRDNTETIQTQCGNVCY